MTSKITIAVDDEPRGCINLKDPQPVRLQLEPGAVIIEALAEEARGRVPLGLIYLDWDPVCDPESPAEYELKLKGHCTLKFLISYTIDSDGDEEAATVTVNCVATGSQRAAAHG